MEGGVRCFKKNNGRIVLSVFLSDFIRCLTESETYNVFEILGY